MPSTCSVIGCKSRGNMPMRKFFKFPMLNNSSAKTLAITQARQQAWLIALNRADFFASYYKSSKLCDLHFISGRAAHYMDVNSPDWVPSKNLGYEVVTVESNPTEINPIGDPEVVGQCDTYEIVTEESNVSEQCLTASKETQTEIRTTLFRVIVIE